jgi:Tfp pilus assembly protein PilO
MSLEKRFEDLPEGIESDDIKELRSAILRLQKQLKQAKERNEDLVFATNQAAYDAMLTFGKIVPVPEVIVDKRKSQK